MHCLLKQKALLKKEPLLGRFLLVQKDCPHCLQYMGIVQEMNAKVVPGKEIEVIDVTLFVKYGINTHPIIDKFEWDGVPHLRFDGVDIPGIRSANEVIGILNELFKNDMVET